MKPAHDITSWIKEKSRKNIEILLDAKKQGAKYSVPVSVCGNCSLGIYSQVSHEEKNWEKRGC
jgi:hypothetical protein